ncbi:MAG: 2-dehydro-3-deoxygalactonokinase [Acidobacteria bacterium]|nr:2-dehydro-3-deoxygalactonokinase [Acidobacteriota bacterium]
MTDRLALVGFEWAGAQLRAWAFDDDGEVLTSLQVREEAVAGHADWPARLQFHLSEWLGTAPECPLIGCGDVSAGLVVPANPSLQTPFPLAALPGHIALQGTAHLVPWIGQGVPPDLTCGAETVLMGLEEPHGAICILGRYSQHCVLEHGRLVEFSTEITAEMRDLLLMHGTLALGASVQQAFDMKVFRDWIERALDTDDSPPVFSVEAAIRQGVLDPANKAAALAGLMIGADVAAHYDPGDDVLLVADGPLLEAYGFALDALGADVEETSAVEALQDGLFELADLAGLLGEA